MARTDTLNNFLTDVADAIRSKTETTGKIPASEFDTRIAGITTGGGTEDLSTPLTAQDNLITIQESKLTEILIELQNKASGGSTDIEDGLIERNITGEYINNRITTIGNNSLRTLPISGLHCENVTSVAGEAVRQCNNLTYVYLPKCTTLGGYSFGICPLLERVELDSVETIKAYDFYNCPKLTTFIIRTTSKVCSLANVSAFTSSGIANGTGYVYVNDSLVDSYKSSTNWSSYADQIKPLSELEG